MRIDGDRIEQVHGIGPSTARAVSSANYCRRNAPTGAHEVRVSHSTGTAQKLLARCRNDEIFQIERLEIGNVLPCGLHRGPAGPAVLPIRGPTVTSTHTASGRMSAHLRAPLAEDHERTS